MPLEPTTPAEMADAVHASPRVLTVGAHTKPRLAAVSHGITLLSTRCLSGITEYEPEEFTFTALAGTPVREIVETLAARGQYLPFDPILVEAGATIGGTVAAGFNGPGRLRYGGIRDFILAVQFVDGRGKLLRGGAKVVKNAAGFDVPKFLVGSLGRYGVLVEVTFKVFPRPTSWTTLSVATSIEQLAGRLSEGAVARWELDALNYDREAGMLYARIGGPAEANTALAAEIMTRWPSATVMAEDDAAQWWRSQVELDWAEGCDFLAKVPMTLAKLPSFLNVIAPNDGSRVQISGAGSVAWAALPDASDSSRFDAALRTLELRALTLRGDAAPLFLGAENPTELHERVQRVFDPERRFAAD
jgi:glycolate oxidase FAD binding subunit